MRLANCSKGFSMLELLIAVFVMAIGVLGVSSAQMLSLKNNQSSYHRSQANILVMDILDRMRANPRGVQNGHYASIDSATTYTGASCASTTAGCSPADIAKIDKAEWTDNFSTDGDVGLIPGSSGKVDTTISGTEVTVTVTVNWSENEWDKAQGVNVDSTKQLEMTVRL